MTVYVDDAFIRFGRMKMCHMIADSRKELIGMVQKIGVDEKHIQHAGTYQEHFDIAKGKRALAIRHGAVPVTRKQLVAVLRERKGARRGQ